VFNNEQVWKVSRQNSAETCLEMDYFGSKFPPKSPSAGSSVPRLGAPSPDPLASGGWRLRPPGPHSG